MILEFAVLTLGFLISLLVCFFYSGAEAAIISANQYRLRHSFEQGDARAGRTLAMLTPPSRIMTAVLIGNSFGHVLAVLLARLLLERIWVPPAQHAFGWVGWDELIILIGLTPFLIVFAEILPKALFRARADSLIQIFRVPLSFSRFILGPGVIFLEGVVKLFLLPFGGRGTGPSRRLTRGDLLMMLDRSPWAEVSTETEEEDEEKKEPVEAPPPVAEQAAWIREPDERRLIQNIIELSQRQAREIMQPLVELEAVHLGQTTLDGFLALARRSGHSRFPAYRHRIVRLVGYIDLYEVIRDTSGKTNLEDFVHPAYFVPDTKRVDDLLQEFLQRRISSAIVVDEYGGCSGWISREDIMEEIVGELEDELDEPVIPIMEQPDGSFRIEGRCPIEDVNEILRAGFDDKDCDTFGGIITKTMGRIPKIGDEITLAGWRIRVAEMEGMRVAVAEASPAAGAPSREN